MGSRNELTYHAAIQIVLAKAGRPLRSFEIAREIVKQRLRFIPGNRSRQIKFINARISEDVKNNYENTPYKRTSRGTYTLRTFPGQEYKSISHVRRLSHRDKDLRTDRVLVFEPLELEKTGYFNSIQKNFKPYTNLLLNPQTSFFLDRREAESTEEAKQIVSYVLVKFGDSLLRYVRGEITNVKDVLFGEYSLGFGGHVQEKDWNLFSRSSLDFGYSESVRRELFEELRLDPYGPVSKSSELIGVLNDDTSPLGRKHFAFIHLVELSKPEFQKGEKSINQLELISIDKLADQFESYEYWAKLCIRTFFGDRLSFTCKVQVRKNFEINKHSNFILVTGNVGSGKTEACALLEREFGYKVVPCSRIMQQIIGCPPIEEIGRKALQDYGYEFINRKDGHRKLAEGIWQFIGHNPNEKYALDGLRFPETLYELEYLAGEKITVIYIDNLIDNLYKYYQEREVASQTTFREFLDIVHHPVERHIGRFRPRADINIYNHGSLIAYISELQRFFKNASI